MKVRNILGTDYTSGDYITCTITGRDVFGRIYFDNDRIYDDFSMWICHNDFDFDGSASPDKLGMKFSWVFRLRNGLLTDDVTSINKFLKIEQKDSFQYDEKITQFFQSIDRGNLNILIGFKTGQFDDFSKIEYIDKQGMVRLSSTKKYLGLTTTKNVEVKISRLIRTITNSINIDVYNLSDVEIEKIYNQYVSFQNNELFDIQYLKGEDILKGYLKENYAGSSGNIHGSCMTDHPEFLKIYTKNRNVELATITNGDKIIARCIVWTLKDGKKAFDRIYYSYEWSNTFLRTKLLDEKIIDISEEYGDFIVELEEATFDEYPYVDTLYVLDQTKKTLSNKKCSSTLCLRQTNGRFTTI
jgi:hypothetical protein